MTFETYFLKLYAMFTLSRGFVRASFLRCNRLFPVHCQGVEEERRDAFPLKSERLEKTSRGKILLEVTEVSVE